MSRPVDHDWIVERLNRDGFVVVENVLSSDEVSHYRAIVDRLMQAERDQPFLPPDGMAFDEDAAIRGFFRQSYTVSEAELDRLMQRARHTRHANQKTPWPVPPNEVNKCFLHLPTLFDQDRSQRIWNLLSKSSDFSRLIEHPLVLDVVRDVLGSDCILSDCSATSIGAETNGGAWHVDVPLGQLPEPLPDFPLSTQNVWMLDDFTEHNGATRVVKSSHLSRKKPHWADGPIDGEEVLTAPAGSVAIWLSNTWHRSGPNVNDAPRRAILCYYARSWVKPFTDFRATMTSELLEFLSPTVRYLIGYSASPIVRG